MNDTEQHSPTAEMQVLVDQVIAPAFAAMLRPGECTRVTLEIGGVAGRQNATLTAEINAEEFVTFVSIPGQAHLSSENRRARLMSDLQDFLAEGTRTWGEFRPIPAVPIPPEPDAVPAADGLT